MSLNLNQVTLAGNLTRDPELRTVGSDQVVANFGLATNRRWRGNDGEQKEEVTFVDCECWGRTAELVGQYLAKGRPAYCQGRLKLDQWEDQEGKKRSRLKVQVTNVQFLGSPPRDGERPNQDAAPDQGRPPRAAHRGSRDAVAEHLYTPELDDDPPF